MLKMEMIREHAIYMIHDYERNITLKITYFALTICENLKVGHREKTMERDKTSLLLSAIFQVKLCVREQKLLLWKGNCLKHNKESKDFYSGRKIG